MEITRHNCHDDKSTNELRCTCSEGPLHGKSPSCASCKPTGVTAGTNTAGVTKRRLCTAGEDRGTSLLMESWTEGSLSS